ncbi:MAG: hypothetical protein K2I89_04570, partial [Muribaculaceae bacterium]|nr:hypothetical protein [Muribaculaceae bacterium]
MDKTRDARRMSFAAVFVAAVVMVTNIRAVEPNDGTITIPRSGKEIVSLPSPEAAELCRHIDHAIDYSTGCVSLNFPLFTYDCGGISLPLSISYRTGGIKADSEPGALGVGWELNCGGFVSRSVVGMPDDAPNVPFCTKATSLDSLKKLHNNTADAMYDRYNFSAGGYSGSFLVFKKNIIYLTPTDAKIVCTASGFDITVPDGTLYHYDIPETLTYTYRPSSYSNASSVPDYTCECMWRLSKIESPSRKESVTFTYGTVSQLQKTSSQTTIAASWESKQKTAMWSANDKSSPTSTATHTYTNRHRIASIRGRGGSISFSYDAEKSEKCTSITVRDYNGNFVRQVNFGAGRTLSSYRIIDSAANVLDGADFTYFPAKGDDKDKDFFGYRNGGGSKSAVSYNPDSLSTINNEPYRSALDKLLRPSWKRQPILDYTRSESLQTISTVAGTETKFEYELHDAGYFLTYGRISPGVRLKKETVTDHNTGNERVRSLSYSNPVPSVDFSALREQDFVSVSGTYTASTRNYSTGATISASCRLQGAALENACVYYGKVTETITGTGIPDNAPIVTDYEYDTTNACSKLCTHTNWWSDDEPRVAGAKTDRIFAYSNDQTPGWVYEKLLAVNVVRGYFNEIIGDRAPLKKVTHWRIQPNGRSVWRCTQYHNSRSTSDENMGIYSEAVIRMKGGLSSPDMYAIESYDFKDASDFNRFDICATTVKVYVDSITETEYDELGTPHTVIQRMGYNDKTFKWFTGLKSFGNATGSGNIQLTYLTTLPSPKIDNTRKASNSLLNICIVGCGDEWVRTDYIYSSTSDTPQMRALDNIGVLSLPVENYYTTGHGFEYDNTAVSEKFTYTNGSGAYDMRLSSDVIRSKADGLWFTLDSLSVGAHDSYGNPLLVRRNGGTPSYYGWSNNGTTLSYAKTAGQKTTYLWQPLIGCTSATAPSGLKSSYIYWGSRLSGVNINDSRVKSYAYSVHGIGSGTNSFNYVNEVTVIDASTSVKTCSYFDGFGNRTGSVTTDKTGSNSIATLDVYDAVGRLKRSYTPRPASTPYTVPSAANPSGDVVPYSVITYSGSGDSRPLSATIAGEEYRGHPSRSRHLFSRAHSGGADSVLSCRRYRPGSSSGSVTLTGYYPEGALSVEETTDGDGRRKLTFTDFRGR